PRQRERPQADDDKGLPPAGRRGCSGGPAVVLRRGRGRVGYTEGCQYGAVTGSLPHPPNRLLTFTSTMFVTRSVVQTAVKNEPGRYSQRKTTSALRRCS